MKRVKNQIEEITEKIEENGGINCGWRSKDHTKFMEILFRMKNRIDSTPFLDECSIQLALYSEEALQQHITQFKTYKNLEEEKKEVMEIYKKLKKEVKFIESVYKNEEVQKVEAKSRKKVPQRTEEERAKQKEKLEKWKK